MTRRTENAALLTTQQAKSKEFKTLKMVSGIERHISALSRRRTIKQQASSQRPHLWQVHWKFVPSDSRVCTHIVELSYHDLRCYHDAKPQEAHRVSLDLRWVIYRPVGLKAKTMKLACQAIW